MTEEELFQRIRNLPGSESRIRAEKDIWKEFGRECAVLVLDSSGFTRSTREGGIINFLSCIVQLRDVLKEVLEESGCITCRFATDNAFAEFETAYLALEAALTIREAVRSSDIKVCDGSRMEVCMGIGYGRMLLSGSEGVFGHQMNLASKLGEDVAERGEILLTESAYFSLLNAGEMNFKRDRVSISGLEIPYYRLC